MTKPNTDDCLVDKSRGAEVNFPTPPTKASVPDWYPELLDAVADCVRTGRQRAVSAANQELVSTYWAVGAEILARQDAEGWGTRVIDRLSADLRERFPGTSGFSPRNLKYMRAFAAAWPDFAIVQRSVAQLPWRHNVALLDKLDTAEMRLWYGQAAIEQGGAVTSSSCISRDGSTSALAARSRTSPESYRHPTRIWRSNRPAIRTCLISSATPTSDASVTSNEH